MKLNLVSLISFFTIANTVNGQFLRVDKDQQNRVTTVQEQDAKLVATLDLDDKGAHLEFFDDGDGIIIMGTGANEDVKKMDHVSTALNELSPVESFEQLSGKAAPADLVNAQTRIEQLMGTPSNKTIPPPPPPADDATSLKDSGTKIAGYNYCDWYLFETGNNYYYVATNSISGQVQPHYGCVGIKTEKFNGRYWLNAGSGRVYHTCAGGVAWASAWGAFMTYSIDIVEANGDGYDVEVCWD